MEHQLANFLAELLDDPFSFFGDFYPRDFCHGFTPAYTRNASDIKLTLVQLGLMFLCDPDKKSQSLIYRFGIGKNFCNVDVQ
jgi:hypothetical protein